MKYKICIDDPFPCCECVYPIQQRKVKEMLDYLKEDDNVISVTLFGSSITNYCHIDSDVDLYVELKENKKVIKRYFDLCTNYTVDSRLLKEIKSKGIIIYKKEDV